MIRNNVIIIYIYILFIIIMNVKIFILYYEFIHLSGILMCLNDSILIGNVAIFMIAILVNFHFVSIVILIYINDLYLIFMI